MYFLLYKTTNINNRKIYVGIHKSKMLEFDGYLGSGVVLTRSIYKHGKEAFKRETLQICSSWEEAKIKEQLIVTEEFCKRDDTYNICVGGTGGNTMIQYSENQKQLVFDKRRETRDRTGSRIYLGEKLCKAQERMKRVRIQPNNKGRIHTEQSRRNMLKGNKSPGTRWITNGKDTKRLYPGNNLPSDWFFGRGTDIKRPEFHHTEEQKQKTANLRRGDVCYNNGTMNVKLKTGMVPPHGFTKGMIQHHRPRIWITNGINNKGHTPNDPIPDGWIKGRYRKKGKKYEKQNHRTCI